MLTMERRPALAAGAVLSLSTLALSALAACSSGGTLPATQPTAAGPVRIVAAPKNLRWAAEPQPNGTIWTLAGDDKARALVEYSLSGGQQLVGTRAVSNSARSIAESSSGTVGVALGAHGAGALEVRNGSTGTLIRTVAIGAPARQVTVGSDESTFYVLNGTAAATSVTLVNSRNGQRLGTVPVPLETVSVVPDVQGFSIYALQQNGLVDQIAVAGGRIMSTFRVGDPARSIALSPDGSTLYVLKGLTTAPNVAVVDVGTQSVREVLPAPANCLQILVSPDGSELYQMVGTPQYGNIQVFAS